MPPATIYEQESFNIISTGGHPALATINSEMKSTYDTPSNILSGLAPVFTPGKKNKANMSPSGKNNNISAHDQCLEEVFQAAQFWARSLKSDGLSQGQLATFEQTLRNGLAARCEGHWYPQEPMRGSGHRAIINDITIDPLLVTAAAQARIPNAASRLPKCIVWVNPAVVRVQLEQERHPCTIFSTSNTSSGASSSESDSD